jgi:hypothetical protein
MEKTFELLAQIQPVAPEKDLWQVVLQKKNKIKKLPLTYVSAAAACLALLISTEIFLIQNNTKAAKSQDLSSLLPPTNNILTYE